MLWASALEAPSALTSFFHASWHSWMISTAYFLDLASPEKAKTFCGSASLTMTGPLNSRASVATAITYLWLSIGDFVDSEPLVGSSDQAREVPLDILDIVEPGSQGVVDVNNKDLPVGLSFIEEGHDTEDLDLLDLTGVTDGLSNLADVEGVVVTVSASLGVLDGGVFPSLGESSVVPDVT